MLAAFLRDSSKIPEEILGDPKYPKLANTC